MVINFIGVIRIVRVIGKAVRDARVIFTSDGNDGLRIAGIVVSQVCGLFLIKQTYIIGH